MEKTQISPKFKRDLENAKEDLELYPPINVPYRAEQAPVPEEPPKDFQFPEFFKSREMAPQIVPSKFADCRSLKDTLTKIGNKELKKTKKTPEELALEAQRVMDRMNSKSLSKWSKAQFEHPERRDRLELSHWKQPSRADRISNFSRFNTKAEVVQFKSGREYLQAELHLLPSSSSWTYFETCVLLDLCVQYDLRFVIIADRFPSVLKEKYDQKNIKQLDLEHLCRTATNFETKQEINEADKTAIRKRDLKTIEKYIRVQKMDQNAFEKTIEEIKYRYYEVSRRLLKFRGTNSHQYFKYQEFDIEQEISRKNNWERIMNRGREQFEKENQILADHLKIEAQIRKVEEMDQKKREVIAALARVRLPGVVPCDMIDQKSVVAKRKEEQAAEANKGANSLYAKVGIPSGQSTTGVYFLSNAMSQDPPLNQPLVEQMKIMYEALDINPNELFPSSRVYEKLHEINQQMLVMFQLKHMIDEKKQDFEMLKEKEEQIEQVVNAQTWNIKEMLDQKLKDKVAYTARQALPEHIAIQNGLCSAMNQQTQNQYQMQQYQQQLQQQKLQAMQLMQRGAAKQMDQQQQQNLLKQQQMMNHQMQQLQMQQFQQNATTQQQQMVMAGQAAAQAALGNDPAKQQLNEQLKRVRHGYAQQVMHMNHDDMQKFYQQEKQKQGTPPEQLKVLEDVIKQQAMLHQQQRQKAQQHAHMESEKPYKHFQSKEDPRHQYFNVDQQQQANQEQLRQSQQVANQPQIQKQDDEAEDAQKNQIQDADARQPSAQVPQAAGRGARKQGQRGGRAVRVISGGASNANGNNAEKKTLKVEPEVSQTNSIQQQQPSQVNNAAQKQPRKNSRKKEEASNLVESQNGDQKAMNEDVQNQSAPRSARKQYVSKKNKEDQKNRRNTKSSQNQEQSQNGDAQIENMNGAQLGDLSRVDSMVERKGSFTNDEENVQKATVNSSGAKRRAPKQKDANEEQDITSQDLQNMNEQRNQEQPKDNHNSAIPATNAAVQPVDDFVEPNEVKDTVVQLTNSSKKTRAPKNQINSQQSNGSHTAANAKKKWKQDSLQAPQSNPQQTVIGKAEDVKQVVLSPEDEPAKPIEPEEPDNS